MMNYNLFKNNLFLILAKDHPEQYKQKFMQNLHQAYFWQWKTFCYTVSLLLATHPIYSSDHFKRDNIMHNNWSVIFITENVCCERMCFTACISIKQCASLEEITNCRAYYRSTARHKIGACVSDERSVRST